MKYFSVEKHPDGSCYMIYPKHNAWCRGVQDGGAYPVLMARLLGLSLAKALRLIKGKYQDKVMITGKNCYYPRVQWKTSEAAKDMASILNNNMQKMIDNK